MKQLMVRSITVGIVLLLGLAWWLPVKPPVSVFAEGDGLTARIETRDYVLSADRIDVPGYALNTIPGAPLLPLRGITFDLPLTGAWDVTFESVETSVLDGRASIPAVPVPDLNLNGPVSLAAQDTVPSSVPVVNRPDPAIYTVNALYPPSPVQIGEAIRQGDKRILPVRVFPFQYNPVTRELVYHPDIRIAVQLNGASHPEEPSAPPTPVQPERAIARLGVTMAARIYTRERGMHRLTYTELAAAGIPVGIGGSDPRKFVLHNDGQPVDIQLVGGADGKFDPGDLVIFYAVPYTGRYQNYNVYTLAVTDQPNTATMSTRLVTAPGILPATSIISQTTHIEYDRDYRSLYERPMTADHWFDTQLYANVSTPTVIRDYDVLLDDPVTTDGTLSFTALIHGGNTLAANPDQSAVIRLNGNSVGQHTWDGSVDHTITASLPATWLSPGSNRITLEAALAQLPGVTAYWISPDWIEMNYPATAEPEQDRIYIEGIRSASATVAVNGFSAPEVKVYDVRQPAHPVQLVGPSAQVSGSAFAVTWNDTAPNRSYFLSTQDALLAPSHVEVDVLSNWGSPNHQADYIAIVGAQRSYTGTTSLGNALSVAVQPLLDHREAEGLQVAKVDVLDIYDEFSYGKVDPQAIRDFLTFAYWNWNQDGSRPRYVLLVGDGHYDFTQVSGQPLPNLIPPYLLHVDPWWGEVPVDNRFVSTDGFEDYLPNLSIGRLPANSVADVTAMVQKTLAYEDTGVTPPGPWQQRAIYVADDCANSAGDFHTLSNYGRVLWLPSAYSNRKIYFDNPNISVTCPDGTQTSSTGMRSAVRNAYDQGALYMQWFGHGSQTQWGSPVSFHRTDPPLLNSSTTVPLTVANACLTGYFVWKSPFTPYPYLQSLAEIMVITPGKGSVVDFSPSGLHVGSALLTLNQGVHRALFQDRIERAGDVTDSAKQYFFDNSFAWHDVIDTMIVFGDPATLLRLPTGDLSTSSMEVSDSTATPGATLYYTVTVENSSIYTVTHPTVAVDYPQELTSVTDPNGGANNGDTLSWTLPNLLPNTQTVVAFALQANTAMPSISNDLTVSAEVGSQMAPSVALQVNTFVPAEPLLVDPVIDVNRSWLPPGMPVTTTVDLINVGTAPASGSQVTITLPSAFDAPTVLSSPNAAPIYDPLNHRVTWLGDALVGQTTLTVGSSILSSITTCGQIAVAAEVADPIGTSTALSTTVNLAVPDVDCNGVVDIADIQQVAALWPVGSGDPGYHPRYDLNADDVIDVLDIAVAASSWN